MSYILNNDRIIMGVDYYPEHWDRDLWADDLARMKKTGIEVIRIAEFAWNIFEPHEGEYDYSFFDEFLNLCERFDMKVIFGTPTATPPAWMSEKYPEILNARIDGVLLRHGARRHYNYNSPVYQEFSSKIVERIASHYAPNKQVIGWQIDNEINCEINEFYSESDTVSFRSFLKEKYVTLNELNKAWGTVFWNQTYTSWEEVYVPRVTISGAVNPHEVLDYKRFVSDSACKWALLQSEIIRKYIKPGDFVTTNGLFGNLDNHRMTRESLDFITYDSYPNMAYEVKSNFSRENALNDRAWGRTLDEVRSIKGIFGIMEQQSGANGWNISMEAPTPRPGQITLWTMQSISHGADYIGYFRWRTSTIGTEIYWHGILDYSGRDNRRLFEVKDIHDKFEKLTGAGLAGCKYDSNIGIIETYDNKWDAELDSWHRMLDECSMKGIYEASQYTHTPIDFVYLFPNMSKELLSRYKVLIWPHAVIASKEQAALLSEYVNGGGTLVFGCRAGYKNSYGHCVQDNLPGVFAELTGVDVTEYTLVAKDEGPVYADWDGDKVEMAVFNDELGILGENAREEKVPTNDRLEANAERAEVLARYLGSYYSGAPALIHNKFGKGDVYYFGAAFTRDTASLFFNKLGVVAPYRDVIEVPASCEISCRVNDGDGTSDKCESAKDIVGGAKGSGSEAACTSKERLGTKKKFYFVLNYLKDDAEIEVKEPLLNVYTGSEVQGKIILKGYETIVLKHN